MSQLQGRSASALLVRDLPIDERPRDRLLHNGSASLSDAELVSILLRSGRPGVSSIAVARELLSDQGGLAGLVGAAPEELRRPGLGEAKAATLLASVELARRLARAQMSERDPMQRPAAVARYLRLRYARPDQEVMGALYLDTRNRLVAEEELFAGTLSRAAVEPRALLNAALRHHAAGMMLFHTHPSGDPAPSAEDLAFTRRLAKAGDHIGIRLVDHLILGAADRWVSLNRMGEL